MAWCCSRSCAKLPPLCHERFLVVFDGMNKGKRARFCSSSSLEIDVTLAGSLWLRFDTNEYIDKGNSSSGVNVAVDLIVGVSDGTLIPFTIEPSHPYYLHPSDSPGIANDMVLAWILKSLELEIKESVIYTKIEEKLWKDIER
ncbi:hypothetical protein HAX54_001284, partial [Datura stramonium]|nr:hypothetical protein [Datura stramonium]